MIIGIISDTHGNIHSLINKYFKQVDLIIHAGDIGSMNVINSLEKITKVEAVKGNMDCDFIWNEFSEEKTLEIQGKKILLTHRLPHNYKNIAKEKKIDIIIYGHTHTSEIINEEGLLLINPGAAGGKNRGNNTIAILEINEENEMNTKIIDLK